MKTLDYIPAIIAFLAVAMGVSPGAKWDSSQQHLTPYGYATVALGITALISSLALTFRRHRDSDAQSLQRARIKEIADSEVRLALRKIAAPFFVLFDDESEKSYLELVPHKIDDAATLTIVHTVDMRSQDMPFRGGTFGISWAEVLELNANHGVTRIDRALQIYANFLEPSVIETLSEIRTGEFLVMRMQRLVESVEMNESIGFLHFPFPGYRDGEDFGYTQFWSQMRKLDKLLIKSPERLHRRL